MSCLNADAQEERLKRAAELAATRHQRSALRRSQPYQKAPVAKLLRTSYVPGTRRGRRRGHSRACAALHVGLDDDTRKRGGLSEAGPAHSARRGWKGRSVQSLRARAAFHARTPDGRHG